MKWPARVVLRESQALRAFKVRLDQWVYRESRDHKECKDFRDQRGILEMSAQKDQRVNLAMLDQQDRWDHRAQKARKVIQENKDPLEC